MQSLIELAQSILPEGDGRVQVPPLPTQNQTHHLPKYFSLAWMGVSSKGSCVVSLVPNVVMVHSSIFKGWGQVEAMMSMEDGPQKGQRLTRELRLSLNSHEPRLASNSLL